MGSNINFFLEGFGWIIEIISVEKYQIRRVAMLQERTRREIVKINSINI